MPDSGTVSEWLAAVALAAAACWLLYRGLAHLFLKLPQSEWIPVRGKIQISGIEEDSDGDGGKDYRAVIEYVYEYKGTRFLNSRVGVLRWTSMMQFAARNLTRRYPPGREVTVYVNPLNPGDSVLDRGRQVFDALLHCLFGLAFALASFLIVGRP